MNFVSLYRNIPKRAIWISWACLEQLPVCLSNRSLMLSLFFAGVFQCPLDGGDGPFKDPNSCFHYYLCFNGTALYYPCPKGTEFKPSLHNPCNSPTEPYCHVWAITANNKRSLLYSSDKEHSRVSLLHTSNIWHFNVFACINNFIKASKMTQMYAVEIFHFIFKRGKF